MEVRRMKPNGRIPNAVAWCSFKYHMGDMTNDMVYDNCCIEKKCHYFVAVKEKYRKKIERYRKGEICRHDMYGKA